MFYCTMQNGSEEMSLISCMNDDDHTVFDGESIGGSSPREFF